MTIYVNNVATRRHFGGGSVFHRLDRPSGRPVLSGATISKSLGPSLRNTKTEILAQDDRYERNNNMPGPILIKWSRPRRGNRTTVTKLLLDQGKTVRVLVRNEENARSRYVTWAQKSWLAIQISIPCTGLCGPFTTDRGYSKRSS